MSENRTAVENVNQVTELETPQGTFAVHSAGAHVTRWDSADMGPMLFVSEASGFGVGVPVRGGIPLCFPWFGPLRGDAYEVGVLGREHATVNHGFARILNWHQTESEQTEDGRWKVSYELTETDVPEDPNLDDQVVQPFTATFTAQFANRTLDLEFLVENRDHRAFVYELAFHTYFLVGDIREVSVSGLEGAPYFDKVANTQDVVDDTAISFGSQTDRVYKSDGPVEIVDPTLARRIRITKEGSDTTVVWNPGEEVAAKIPDLADTEWAKFVCVETANALEDPIVLPPGQSHVTKARYEVERLTLQAP